MFRFSRRRVLRSYLVIVTGWALVIVFMHMALGGWSPLSHLFGHSFRLSQDQLIHLMDPEYVNADNFSGSHDPLLQILSPTGSFFHLFNLPKRKRYVQYGEVTSANRDSRFPLAPDFTFHINYSTKRVTLYEDYGRGCIFRIFIYPHLPTNAEILHRMSSANLSSIFLLMTVDNKDRVRYSLRAMAEAQNWPFVFPLSAKHPLPSSGVGAYTPFCYEQSMLIQYEHNGQLPDNLLELTVNCTANELLCPVHIYSAVSRHRFPLQPGHVAEHSKQPVDESVHVSSELESSNYQASAADVARLLENPEMFGPNAADTCMLSCFELCPQCQHVIYHHIHSARVITSLRMRIFYGNGSLVQNWAHVLFTAFFDDASEPQFDHMPLGSLFGATASLNDVRGASFGKRSVHCYYDEVKFDSLLPRISTTGYFYLPMPYWKEALIVLDGADDLVSPVTVCFQFTDVENFYIESETAYLHGAKTYYSDDVAGWRRILDVHGGWGQMVGLSAEIDNLSAVRDVPSAFRWAALQSDNVIYIDNLRSPTVLGTGFEDYFSYAHGFAGAENTTYAFVGVHHTGPKRSEPLTWHCYRQHILDPIIFHTDLEFLMEGTNQSTFSTAVAPITYAEHQDRLAAGLPAFAYFALYYFRTHISGQTSICDRILMSDLTSERKHSFKQYSRHGNETFSVVNHKFLGDTAHNRTFSLKGRIFYKGDHVNFKLLLDIRHTYTQVFRLRRTFYMAPRQWNDKAQLWVNQKDLGTWFVPMGSLTEEYSLHTDDRFLLRNQVEFGKAGGHFNIWISPESDSWNDVEYEICALPN